MQWNNILYSAYLFMWLKELSFYIYLSHPLLNNKEMIQFKKYLVSALDSVRAEQITTKAKHLDYKCFQANQGGRM